MKEKDFPWRVEKIVLLQGTEEERMGSVSEDVEELMEDGNMLWDLFQDNFIPNFDKELFLEALEEEGFEFLVDHIQTPIAILALAVPVPQFFGEEKDGQNPNYGYSWGIYLTKFHALDIRDIGKTTEKLAIDFWDEVTTKELMKWKSQNP